MLEILLNQKKNVHLLMLLITYIIHCPSVHLILVHATSRHRLVGISSKPQLHSGQMLINYDLTGGAVRLRDTFCLYWDIETFPLELKVLHSFNHKQLPITM